MVGQPMRKETERMLIVVAALVVACGLCFWIAGEALTFLASGHFSGASVLTAVFIPLRLLFSSSAPMGAWPEDASPLFSSGPFWILSMALIGFSMWLAYRSGPRIGAFMGRGAAPKSAKLAQSNDLSALIVRSPQQGRIVLGRAGGKLLAAALRASVLVFGPTQTGKTTGVAVPTIIEWDGPALITSVKTDLLDDTIAARREMGEVMVFDPAQVVDMHKRSSWTPLARARTYEGATKTGKALVQSAKQMMGGGKENDFWFMHAQTLMGPLLYAAAVGGRDIGDVVRWLDQQEEDEPTQILMATFDGLDDLPLSALEGIWKMGEQQKDSVYLTALSVVEAYRSPKVLDTARKNEIRPEQLLDGGNHTAYLCAPMHEQEALASLYATLIKQIIDWAYEAYTRTGEPLDPPLLIVLDEAANIAPLSDLKKIASTAAGVGIQLVTIFQDLGQVRERWGHDKAQTIVSNHRATMVLSGIKCEHTLEWVAKVTGDQEVRQLSYTHGHQNK